VLKKPSIRGLLQQVNEDGKCISVGTKNYMEQCFWRPLDLPLDEPSEGYVRIKNNIKKREMAYFLCDIVSILKKFDQGRITDYIEVLQEEKENFFEPFVVRERFESVNEFISYYSTKLPLLFRNSKIVVDEKVYLQLLKFIGSFPYLRLFSRVIKPKHFTKRDDTVVVVRR
jgi:hypothetical protein